MGQAPVTTATQAALRIVSDPYLKEAACEVLRLSELQRTGRAPGPCQRTDPRYRGSREGVGLEHVVGPLRLYGKHRERPWLFPLLAVSVLGLVFYAGYASGKGRRA
jgi:hypothetical protein